MIVDCYGDDISSCTDCRVCRDVTGCVISDGMQKVYDYVRNCDNVVIASPIYFSQPTGRLLDVFSRFQVLFSARHFLHIDPQIKLKRGAVILTGGGSGGADMAYGTAASLLKVLNVKEIFPLVSSLNTDSIPACDDGKAVGQIKQAAEFLNMSEL